VTRIETDDVERPGDGGLEARGAVVWHTTVSVDGCIAGRNDAMEWAFGHGGGSNRIAEAVVRTTGALLIGRRSYDVGRRGTRAARRKPYGGAWTGPQFVISHRPIDDDPDVVRLTGDVRDAVRTALTTAGGKNVVLIGADVARQALDAGMVDELVLHVAPVLLGAGVRLFGVEGVAPIALDLLETSRTGAVIDLRYGVARTG